MKDRRQFVEYTSYNSEPYSTLPNQELVREPRAVDVYYVKIYTGGSKVRGLHEFKDMAG